MGKSRYRVVTEGRAPHFLTCTLVNWLPLFANPAIARLTLDSLAFLHEKGRLTLHGYVLMENHLHLVASSADLSKEVGDFKSFSLRARPSIGSRPMTNAGHSGNCTSSRHVTSVISAISSGRRDFTRN